MNRIAVRKENKSRFERRAPLSPEHVKMAIENLHLDIGIENSEIRIFKNEEYLTAGARLITDPADADIILGVKEVAIEHLAAEKTYVFFSHVIKGQSHNMPMLKRLMELQCTLIDYEKIADSDGRRLVFFGFHAGLAGMIDSLWILGRKLSQSGIKSPLSRIKQAFEYESLAEACQEIKQAGLEMAAMGLPEQMTPFVVGFAGYGNVSRGAQYVFEHLPFVEVSPDELPGLFAKGAPVRNDRMYKVVFREEHMARRRGGGAFSLQEYYDFPERYTRDFDRFVPTLSLLINAIYGEHRYPRLITRKTLQELHASQQLRLQVIGDVTCDIDGSVEMTTEATDQLEPILLYNPVDDSVVRTKDGDGVAILAVDNLPCELPRDSTRHFGESLEPFLVDLANLDRSQSFGNVTLRSELKKAVILWNGDLTPDYQYLRECIA